MRVSALFILFNFNFVTNTNNKKHKQTNKQQQQKKKKKKKEKRKKEKKRRNKKREALHFYKIQSILQHLPLLNTALLQLRC